jgi:hypothetical protein
VAVAARSRRPVARVDIALSTTAKLSSRRRSVSEGRPEPAAIRFGGTPNRGIAPAPTAMNGEACAATGVHLLRRDAGVRDAASTRGGTMNG